MWVAGAARSPAVIVAFCAVIAPAIYILFMLTVLLAARRSPAPPWVGEMLRWAQHLQPWSMLEVMMLGILVALIKIAELAHGDRRNRDVCGRCTHDAVCRDHGDVRSPRNLDRVEWADGEMPLAGRLPGLPPRSRRDDGHNADRRAGGTRLLRDLRPAVAARQCGEPGLLPAAAARGSRCVATSPSRCTWALVIAAAICYIPANVLPVLTTNTLGVLRARHHHGRRGVPLHFGIVAACAHRADRERDDPARQAGRAGLSPDRGAAPLDWQQPRSARGSIAWSSSSAGGRCWTCSSTRSSWPWCNSSR